MFLDPDFLNDAKMLAIHVYLEQIYDYLIFAWVFRTFWPKMRFVWQNRGRSGAILTPNELVLPLGVRTSVSNLVKIDREMRP